MVDFFVDFLVVVFVVLDAGVVSIAGIVELAVIVVEEDVVSIAAAVVSAALLSFFEHPASAAPMTTSVAIVPSFLVTRSTLPPFLSLVSRRTSISWVESPAARRPAPVAATRMPNLA